MVLQLSGRVARRGRVASGVFHPPCGFRNSSLATSPVVSLVLCGANDSGFTVRPSGSYQCVDSGIRRYNSSSSSTGSLPWSTLVPQFKSAFQGIVVQQGAYLGSADTQSRRRPKCGIPQNPLPHGARRQCRRWDRERCSRGRKPALLRFLSQTDGCLDRLPAGRIDSFVLKLVRVAQPETQLGVNEMLPGFVAGILETR